MKREARTEEDWKTAQNANYYVTNKGKTQDEINVLRIGDMNTCIDRIQTQPTFEIYASRYSHIDPWKRGTEGSRN